MGCGCKKKQTTQVTTNTVQVTENTSVTLTQEQLIEVNELVNKIENASNQSGQ